MAAALVGVAAVWLVLQPLLMPGPPAAPVFEPPDPEETPKGVALAALKEIEFDRETGKLSDEDYEFLKAKYTRAASRPCARSAGAEARRGCRRPDCRQGPGLSLRRVRGTAGVSRVPDLRAAARAGRRVLFDLRTAIAAGRRLRRLRRSLDRHEPVLRSLRLGGGRVKPQGLRGGSAPMR